LREVARLSGTDRKTVRRYVDRARACGVDRDGDACQLTDELLAAAIAGVRPSRPNGESQAWEVIGAEHEQIKAWLKQGLTLTKVHTLLGRRGVVVSYRTLHRYATTELEFGQRRTTVPVADCEPGAEVQVDFGRLGMLTDAADGRRRVVQGDRIAGGGHQQLDVGCLVAVEGQLRQPDPLARRAQGLVA
jgi:hypothetical protein